MNNREQFIESLGNMLKRIDKFLIHAKKNEEMQIGYNRVGEDNKIDLNKWIIFIQYNNVFLLKRDIEIYRLSLLSDYDIQEDINIYIDVVKILKKYMCQHIPYKILQPEGENEKSYRSKNVI